MADAASAMPAPPTTTSNGDDAHNGRLRGLSLAALGIVFGDIGTSPLYSMRECFRGEHGAAPTSANIFGVLSLIFWSLIIVISIKYVIFIMRADNRGEGGILALTALVAPLREKRGRRSTLVLLGLFGAALLYGDGIITPAISVLSAVEGLSVATPLFDPYVVPITIAVLIGLFLFQKRGTAGVGVVFGPVMLVWFLVIALLGVWHIVEAPGIFAAVNPLHGIEFFVRNEWEGFLVLGAVFLVMTGGEALYADLGHFGPLPIRITWFAVVLPALVLNYFGQGALLLVHPEAAINPFYRMVDGWLLYPLVVLATCATIIASQALITAAFSLTMQAVQLGYSPRMTIEHTSHEEKGQVYLAGVNWALMAACIGLVIGFGSSSDLAAAYGVAVSTGMVFTTILYAVVTRGLWKWRLPVVLALCGMFLIVDLAFASANVLKIPQGGWFPLVVAAGIVTLMTTWRRGRELLGRKLRALMVPLERFIAQIRTHPPTRVPGTAVFMSGNPQGTPSALLHNLMHNKILHERVIILGVRTEEIPHVASHERVEVTELGENFYRVTVRYGFMEDPDVPSALRLAGGKGLEVDPMQVTYFLGRENLIATRKRGMMLWREKLFVWMSRNSQGATRFYRLPANRVIELGVQVEM